MTDSEKQEAEDGVKYSNMINASIDRLNVKQNYTGTKLSQKTGISKKEREYLRFVITLGLSIVAINALFYLYLYSTRKEYITQTQANEELEKKYGKYKAIIKPLEEVTRNGTKYNGLSDPNLSRDLTTIRNTVTELTPDPSVVVPGAENFKYNSEGIYWHFSSKKQGVP